MAGLEQRLLSVEGLLTPTGRCAVEVRVASALRKVAIVLAIGFGRRRIFGGSRSELAKLTGLLLSAIRARGAEAWILSTWGRLLLLAAPVLPTGRLSWEVL